jgi:hypothetical protein
MMIFSAQSAINLPSWSHTFGVCARLTDDCRCRLKCRTLSWMPADQEVRPVRLRPQAGRNFGWRTSRSWKRRITGRSQARRSR